MNWNDLSQSTREWMIEMGGYSPTLHTKYKEVKGYLNGCHHYLDSKDLRKLSEACLEVAEWLDKRAEYIQDLEDQLLVSQRKSDGKTPVKITLDELIKQEGD